MLPNRKFLNNSYRFWAVVKLVSETVGYSERTSKTIKDKKMRRYTFDDILFAHEKYNVPLDYCFTKSRKPNKVAKIIVEYLNYRADIIQNEVRTNLLNRDQAKREFEKLKKRFSLSKVKVIMNKQKGDKAHPSYLTNMVNLLAEDELGFESFDSNPLSLGLVIDKHGPVRSISRRMDGMYPAKSMPKIIWEIKEYYGTTTFGSRIADGVYETMLVGEELQSLKSEHKIKIYHALFVDDYFTWWSLGRSYLCRLIDILHSGHVDAIFFGKEVLSEWPKFLKVTKRITK